MSVIKENDTVVLHYTGKLSDGQIFDSSQDREPLEFTLGKGMLIPGFENAVMGMKVDEEKTFDIPSNEAYGEHREDLIQDVPKDKLPEEIKPEVGMQLTSRLPDGREIPVTIAEVSDSAIKVDANHPLAGKDLQFEVKIVEIK